MPTLQCMKCGKTFKKWFVKNYARAGMRSGAGLAYSMVVWPFLLRAHTKCTNCGEVTWIKVLRPKIFSGKEKLNYESENHDK